VHQGSAALFIIDLPAALWYFAGSRVVQSAPGVRFISLPANSKESP
jgi:hypothetical protein